MKVVRHASVPILFAALALAALVAATSCSRSPRRPNVVIVVLDTVRRDVVGRGPRGEKGTTVTPNLDRLAHEGTVFANAWANGPWTVPSHASMFTGLLPSRHRCTGKNPRFRCASPTLAEVLADAGYETAAFFSNPWLTDHMTGMMRGFERCEVAGPPDMRILGLLRARAQGGPETVRNFSRWLAERNDRRPFFVFVNFLEAHLPYDPPEVYRTAFPAPGPPDDSVSAEWALKFNAGLCPPESVDWSRVRYLYAGDVYTADHLLGELVRLLRERGLLDDTVLVVTSDHGENLGDHGFVDHQFGVFETLLAVPLVVRAPGRLPVGVRDDPVSLADLYATVLDVAGVDAPVPRRCRSLLGPPAEAGRPVVAEYAGVNEPLLRELKGLNPDLDEARLALAYETVRVGDLRLTVGSDGSVALYDLARDPGERVNLACERPGAVDSLKAHLPAFPRGGNEGIDVGPEMREWLRSLGYIM